MKSVCYIGMSPLLGLGNLQGMKFRSTNMNWKDGKTELRILKNKGKKTMNNI